MNLKSLMVETRNVEVEFEALPGFKVELGYISKSLTRKLLKEATKSSMDFSGQMEQKLDNDAFLANFCKAAVKGWTGLTYDHLAQLVLINEADVKDMKEEVPFSDENAYFLLKESQAFDNWVNDRVNQLSIFRS